LPETAASLRFRCISTCWEPEYDRFFFDQLKKRSINIFFFRGEFIFELARTAVAEVPQLGNDATYVFARPADIREFVRRYPAADGGSDVKERYVNASKWDPRLLRKIVAAIANRCAVAKHIRTGREGIEWHAAHSEQVGRAERSGRLARAFAIALLLLLLALAFRFFAS
jgi:hypothetical protein